MRKIIEVNGKVMRKIIEVNGKESGEIQRKEMVETIQKLKNNRSYHLEAMEDRKVEELYYRLINKKSKKEKDG